MKIKLYANGQIINPPLRVAQRYIRLGRASIYEEPIKKVIAEKPKSKKVKKAKEEKEEDIIESKTAEEETATENGY
jgi:hypothetical protein